MALDNNYTGLTKLKDWWGKVKANFTYLDERISTIITTPAEGVSAQEIIDARKGETALGDKIDAMDAAHASHEAKIATDDELGHVKVATKNIDEFGNLIFPFTGGVNVMDFGAVGDGATNDSEAIQTALAEAKLKKLPLYFPAKTFLYDQDIVIDYHGAVILCEPLTVLKYTGNGKGLTYGRVGGTTFPVTCEFKNVVIQLETAGAVAFDLGFSYSRFYNLGAVLRNSNQIGYQLNGDTNGTGCYYDDFYGCDVQGRRGIQGYEDITNQVGWKFTFDVETPSRCPNTNKWYGGRVGQVDTAFAQITGTGNAMFGTCTEGIAETAYDIGGTTASNPMNLTIIGVYLEHANVGFDIKANASGVVIINPYATGVPTLFNNNSQYKNTTIIYNENIKMNAKGFELGIPHSSARPKVFGSYPGWIFKNATGYEVEIYNGGEYSQSTDAFAVQDKTNAKKLLNLGMFSVQFYAPKLLFDNGLIGIWSCTGTPDGQVTAPVGHIALRKDGGASTTLYVKESGTGNTGWVAK